MVTKRIPFVVIVVILLALGVYTVVQFRAVTPRTNATYVTLIGYTEVTTGHHIGTVDINDVPSGHYPFHAVATVPEGTRVELISHDVDDALVVAPNGAQGYVGVDSVRELCGSDCP